MEAYFEGRWELLVGDPADEETGIGVVDDATIDVDGNADIHEVLGPGHGGDQGTLEVARAGVIGLGAQHTREARVTQLDSRARAGVGQERPVVAHGESGRGGR